MVAFNADIDEPLPEKELALTKLTPEICDPAPDIVICAFATKVNPLNEVLTEVILGCAAVVTVPAVVALVALETVPVTFAPAIALRPLPLPVNTPVLAVNAGAVTVPLEFSPVNVPTLVI